MAATATATAMAMLRLPVPFPEHATAFGALTQRPPPSDGPAGAVLALPALGSVAEDVLLRHIQHTAGDGLDGAAVWRYVHTLRRVSHGRLDKKERVGGARAGTAFVGGHWIRVTGLLCRRRLPLRRRRRRQHARSRHTRRCQRDLRWRLHAAGRGLHVDRG
jgi:hypothetical protein